MPLPKSSTMVLRHEPMLIATTGYQMTASSPRGTFSQAELTTDRVITRCITLFSGRLQITATVPAGAATGPAAVTGPGGTASGPKPFTVTPGIALSTMSGPPATTVMVAGAGFGAHEAVDIYLGITGQALASASGAGNFAGIAVQIPASAMPGQAYLTAVGRRLIAPATASS